MKCFILTLSKLSPSFKIGLFVLSFCSRLQMKRRGRRSADDFECKIGFPFMTRSTFPWFGLTVCHSTVWASCSSSSCFSSPCSNVLQHEVNVVVTIFLFLLNVRHRLTPSLCVACAIYCLSRSFGCWAGMKTLSTSLSPTTRLCLRWRRRPY